MSTGHGGGRDLFLGIDLGTSQTAVISSRGERCLVRSVVGYPKDIIGVRLLNDTRLIGAEALEQRSCLTLHFPLSDGVLKENSERQVQAAGALLDHAIAQIYPQPGDRLHGVIGVPARASMSSRRQLLQLAGERLDQAVVVSEPFMVAYGQGRLSKSLVIDIGAGTVDLCAMKGTVPTAEEQITLLKAGNYLDEQLVIAIGESHPEVQMTPLLAKRIKEQYGFVGDEDREIPVNLRAAGRPVRYDLGREIRRACTSMLPDILESVEPLIACFDPEEQEEVLQNIVLAGGGSLLAGLKAALVGGLRHLGEIRVVSVEEPAFAGAVGALKLATELPMNYWDQIGAVVKR